MTAITDLRNPAEALAGLRAEAMRAQILGLSGRIDVELLERGRVVHRISGDNYVNTEQWEEFAKGVQKLAWHMGYAGDSTTVTVSPYTARDPRMVPTLRNDHVACWADTTAEDSTDKFPFGEVVAYAHRWAQGSPATRQGIVQPSLCTLTKDAVSFVWEWATPNGNGTYQSVGFRRLYWSATTGDHIIADVWLPSRRCVSTSSFTDAVSTNASTSANFGSYSLNAPGLYYNSGDTSLYGNTFVSPNFKLQRVPVTIDANGDYSLGAPVDESANAIADGLGGNNVATSTRTQMGITRLGASGDWIMVGFTGSTTSRRPTIRRVTAAGSITYTNANGGTYSTESGFFDVTYDGTNLWVVAATAAGVPAIHRIDPATGTISATISAVGGAPANFPAWSSSRGPAAIEWDAAHSWLWILDDDGHIYNMNTSGTWQGAIVLHGGSNSATLSGQHASQTGITRNPGNTDFAVFGYQVTSLIAATPWGLSGIPADVGANLGAVGGPASKLVTIDGNLWAREQFGSYTTGTPTGVAKWSVVAFDERPCFASRTLLAAPVTKTSAQTMRLRYTITFT